MILPDSQCEEHGELLAVSIGTERGKVRYRRYCRPCRRERVRGLNGVRYNSPLDPRCKAGHPKDRFNYGWYGNKSQCITCAKARGRLKR